MRNELERPTVESPTLESLGLLESDSLSDCRGGHAGFKADEHAWAMATKGQVHVYSPPTSDGGAFEMRLCPTCGDAVTKEIEG